MRQKVNHNGYLKKKPHTNNTPPTQEPSLYMTNHSWQVVGEENQNKYN